MAAYDRIFTLLDKAVAPAHAKELIRKLLHGGVHKVSREQFLADPDMMALYELGLLTWEAGCLRVTKKARDLVVA